MPDDKIKPKLFVILGPTAIGKSSLALSISEKYNASIINADSLQIYKYFNIGTSKPTPEERNRVPHYILDFLEPDQDFNAGLYRKMALEVIEKLKKSDSRIIIVGGTFLYVKILLSGIINESENDRELRKRIDTIKDNKGVQYLHRILEKIDYDAAKRINQNDYVRIQRALEVFFGSGSKISELQKNHNFINDQFDVCKIGLKTERENLNSKINLRVEEMFSRGLIGEVKEIISMGYSSDIKPMQSIGYKEVNDFLQCKTDLETAVSLTKQNTRRYAKRQMTWLRKEEDIQWFEIENEKLIFERFEKFFGI